MDFAEHLENTRQPDGSYDLAAATAARAEEIAAQLAEDPEALQLIALKAASSERRTWESRNRDSLKKLFGQESLPGLDLEAKIPLGDNEVRELGRMRLAQIQIRKDMRTLVHLSENETFGAEMRFWLRMERILLAGGTIAEAIAAAIDEDDGVSV